MEYTVNDFPDGTVIRAISQTWGWGDNDIRIIINARIKEKCLYWYEESTETADHSWQLDDIEIVQKPVYELY